MIIKKIVIKNFRSIQNASIELNNVSVFVGNNDAGKSNILKGLNLFFNNQTDVGKEFDFNSDYCNFTIPKAHKPKEIVIELQIQPPKSYSNGRNVKWKRVWRTDGFYQDGEKIKYIDNKDIPRYARIKLWLKRIHFKYIPAIKGNVYFSELFRDLHDTLSFTSEKELKDTASNFVSRLQEHTKKMSEHILEKLYMESNIQLPANLRELFSTLEFQTKAYARPVSLNFRGDGIKARHIPIILKYLADQVNIHRKPGTIVTTTIWGYEEPENNLEMTKAFELSEEFIDYAKNIQIIITTHSPAFYSLSKKSPNIANVFYVTPKENGASDVRPEGKDLDIKMGLLPVITPHIEKEIAKVQDLKKKVEQYQKRIENEKRPALFVEGKTDKKILVKAIKIHIPSVTKIVNIRTKTSGGFNYVKDNLIAWVYLGKKEKVAGLFDNDENAKEAKNIVDNELKCKKAKQEKLLRTYLLKKPPHIVSLIKKGINISFSIEDIFPAYIWKHAQKRGWLECKTDIYSRNKNIKPNKSFEEYCKEKNVTDDELLFINKIKPDRKKEFAKYVTALKGNDQQKAFEYFKPIVYDITNFFNR